MTLPSHLTALTVLAILASLSLPGLSRSQLMAKRSIRHSYYSHHARLLIALDETGETAELERLLSFKRP